MSRAILLSASASAAALALSLQPGMAWAQNTVSGVEVVGARANALNLTTTSDTGSRLGITPLETPASIEILSGETLRARGDISLADAIARSTGIVQQNNPGNGGAANFAARGFSGVGSVTTLVDGMRLFVGAGTVTFPFDPWTVEQVEVLRGPASVMYGQGAIGGAVNVVPRRPNPNMASYDVQAAVGTQGTYRVGVGAGGPVNDQLAYRVDVSRNASDGYVDRGRSGSWALSGSLRWAPTDKLSFVLSNDYGNQKPTRYFGTPLVNGDIDKRVRHRNYNVSDAILRYKDNFTQLRTEWQAADGVRVRNSTYLLNTNRQWKNVETYLYDGAGGVDRFDYIPIKHDQDQLGDTLDVSFDSDFGGGVKNTLVVGGEANKVKFVHSNDGFPGTSSSVSLLNPLAGLYDEAAVFEPKYRTRTRQYGLFVEDQLKLGEQWSVVGGLRYDDYRIRRLNLVTGVQQVDKTLDNLGYRLGVVYAPTKTLSFYGQRSTGSDPLGSLITTSAGQVPFELSTGQQWEAGVKGLFLDGRGEWTLAAYHITKKKLLTRDIRNPAVQVQVGERTSKGLEASLAVQLGAGWSIEANGTVLDAEFTDFTELAGGLPVSRNGNTPPDTPEKTGNLWLSWQVLPQVRAYGGVRYVGRQFGDNVEGSVLPSYTVADAGVEWKFKPNLALNLQVFNLTDKLYATSAYGPDQWILARPRAVELRLTGRF